MPEASSQQGGGQQVNLQTLVSVIQNAVQAQNSIATNIAALTAVLASAFPPPVSGTTTWDPASIATGGSEAKTVSVPGAALGALVQVSFSLDQQGLTLTGYVSSANVVTAVLANNTAGAVDLGSGTLRASVK